MSLESTQNSAPEATLEELNAQLEEAQATMDGAKMGEIEEKIKALETKNKTAAEAVNPETNPGSVLLAAKGDPSTPPEELAQLQAAADAKHLIAKPEETPILHDAHVEQKNTEIRRQFLESGSLPDRTVSFKNIAGKILKLISEEPNYAYNTNEIKEKKAKDILSALDEVQHSFEWSALPDPEFLNEAAKSFGVSVEEMRAKAYEQIKVKAVAGGFDANVFDILISSDPAEVKKEKLQKATSKPVNNANY
jgi:uncharacterized coiled-coil protein SlyX